MAAHDSQSQREFFPCPEGLQQPAAAAQLMAPTPQALHHWPATAAAAIAHTGPQAAAAVPCALAPAQLQQAQHAQLMLPYGHMAVPGGQYIAAYPLCAPGLPHQAPAAAADSSSSGAAPTQPLPVQLGALHIPHMPAAQPQQGGITGLLYVNQKQLASILRRRAKRQKQEAENKLPRVRKPFVNHASHRHAKARPRDASGKFLSKGEIEAQERREGDLADRADARLGQAQLPGRQQERQAGDDGNGGRSRHAPGSSPPQQEQRHEAATLNEKRGVEQPADESL